VLLEPETGLQFKSKTDTVPLWIILLPGKERRRRGRTNAFLMLRSGDQSRDDGDSVGDQSLIFRHDLSPDEIQEIQKRVRSFARRLLANWWRVRREQDLDDFVQKAMCHVVDKPNELSETRRVFINRLVGARKRWIYHRAVDLKRTKDALNEAAHDPNALRYEDKSIATLEVGPVYTGFATLLGQSSEADLYDQGKEFGDRLKQIAAILKRIETPPPTAEDQVDFFAVLLMQLRLKMAESAGHALLELDASIPATVERLLPWTRLQRNRAFKVGWPTIGQLWDRCTTCLDTPPYKVTARKFSQLVSEISQGKCAFHEDLWPQWVRRAKQSAKADLNNDDIWAALFKTLLPDHKRPE